MHRLPHPVPVRLSVFALLTLVVLANSALSAPIGENVLMALLALGGTLIAADTARPALTAPGPDPRPLSPEALEQVRRVKAALEAQQAAARRPPPAPETERS